MKSSIYAEEKQEIIPTNMVIYIPVRMFVCAHKHAHEVKKKNISHYFTLDLIPS